MAWNIGGKGKTVLRAGWGMFYDAFSQDFFVGQLPFNTFNPGAFYNPIGPSGVLFSYTTTDVLVPGAQVFKDYSGSCPPGSYRFGTLGRNSLRGPGYRNFDLALVKTTKVNERLKIQFRAEFFNLSIIQILVHRSIRFIQRMRA